MHGAPMMREELPSAGLVSAPSSELGVVDPEPRCFLPAIRGKLRQLDPMFVRELLEPGDGRSQLVVRRALRAQSQHSESHLYGGFLLHLMCSLLPGSLLDLSSALLRPFRNTPEQDQRLLV